MLVEKIKVKGERILIEIVEAKNTSSIILPDQANSKEKPRQARVVKVGEGKKLDDGSFVPLEVKEGDLVVFEAFSGAKVQALGSQYLIIDQSHILLVIEGV